LISPETFSWIIGIFGRFFRTECFGSEYPKFWITVYSEFQKFRMKTNILILLWEIHLRTNLTALFLSYLGFRPNFIGRILKFSNLIQILNLEGLDIKFLKFLVVVINNRSDSWWEITSCEKMEEKSTVFLWNVRHDFSFTMWNEMWNSM
jgi:hypothetical protein